MVAFFIPTDKVLSDKPKPSFQTVIGEYGIELTYENIKEHKTSKHYYECASPTIYFPKKWGSIQECRVSRNDKNHLVLNVLFNDGKKLRYREWPIERLESEDNPRLIKSVQFHFKPGNIGVDLVGK